MWLTTWAALPTADSRTSSPKGVALSSTKHCDDLHSSPKQQHPRHHFCKQDMQSPASPPTSASDSDSGSDARRTSPSASHRAEIERDRSGILGHRLGLLLATSCPPLGQQLPGSPPPPAIAPGPVLGRRCSWAGPRRSHQQLARPAAMFGPWWKGRRRLPLPLPRRKTSQLL